MVRMVKPTPFLPEEEWEIPVEERRRLFGLRGSDRWHLCPNLKSGAKDMIQIQPY